LDGGVAYRREHEIDIDGQLDGVDLNPVASFAEVIALLGKTSRSLSKRAESTFKELGYTTPSVIQAQAWPIMLEGRDVIGVSKTGSGKTMGFMLPAVAKVVANKPALLKQKKFGPYVVVLAPTRELAQQITAEAEKLTKPNGLGIICTYGGESRGGQAMRVMRAARAKQFDVLVSTPGRLQDLIDDSTIVLDGTQLLVLDEADRMLDMGFEPQIRAIAESMPPPDARQTLLFSATWPREVKHLALDFTNEAIKVTIGSTDELSANRDITQSIHVITRGAGRSKVDQLLRVLRPGADDGANADELEPPARGARGGSAPAVPQTLVFVNRKRTCDELEALLLDERIRCSALHGDLTQRRREGVIQQFKVRARARAAQTARRVSPPTCACVPYPAHARAPCASSLPRLAGEAPGRDRGDRRGCARPRHQGARHGRQLRLPARARGLRAPDRAHRPRRPQGRSHLLLRERRHQARAQARRAAAQTRPAGARRARGDGAARLGRERSGRALRRLAATAATLRPAQRVRRAGAWQPGQRARPRPPASPRVWRAGERTQARVVRTRRLRAAR
jgi:superfamily II DNA/RNA helicase